MKEKGKVVELKENIVIVKMIRNEACGHCNACEKGQVHLIEALNYCNAKINDEVFVELEGSAFMKAVVILYGLPLVMFMIGISIGYLLSQLLGLPSVGEYMGFAFGIIFALLSYLIIKALEKRHSASTIIPIAKEII